MQIANSLRDKNGEKMCLFFISLFNVKGGRGEGKTKHISLIESSNNCEVNEMIENNCNFKQAASTCANTVLIIIAIVCVHQFFYFIFPN